jgi:hypothetical protein
LERWSSVPLVALLRFRFGKGRAIVRWVRRQYLERRGAHGDKPARSSATTRSRTDTARPAAMQQSD